MAVSPTSDPQDELRKRLVAQATKPIGPPTPPLVDSPQFGPPLGSKPIGPVTPPVVDKPQFGPPVSPKPVNPVLPPNQPVFNPIFKPALPVDISRPVFNAMPEPSDGAEPAGPTTQPTEPTAPVAPPPLAQGDYMGQEHRWLTLVAEATGQTVPKGGFMQGGMPYRGNLQPLVDKFNQKYGGQAKAVGIDKIDFGDGRGPVDVLTGDGRFWYEEPAGAQGPAPRAASAPTGAPADGAPAAPVSDFNAELRAMLKQRLADASKPVDPNDRNIADPMAAARLEADRSSQMERSALAERRAANGDTTATLDQGIQQSAERNAVGLGGLHAKLVQQEYQTRRQELQEYMQLAVASGDAESARALQLKMAELDAAIRREGLSLDAAKYEAYLNQDAAKAGLG